MEISFTVVLVTMIALNGLKLNENETLDRQICLDRDGLSDIDVGVVITLGGQTAKSKSMDVTI